MSPSIMVLKGEIFYARTSLFVGIVIIMKTSKKKGDHLMKMSHHDFECVDLVIANIAINIL